MVTSAIHAWTDGFIFPCNFSLIGLFLHLYLLDKDNCYLVGCQQCVVHSSEACLVMCEAVSIALFTVHCGWNQFLTESRQVLKHRRKSGAYSHRTFVLTRQAIRGTVPEVRDLSECWKVWRRKGQRLAQSAQSRPRGKPQFLIITCP